MIFIYVIVFLLYIAEMHKITIGIAVGQQTRHGKDFR